MKNLLMLAFLFCNCTDLHAQKKIAWYKNYWLGINTSLVKGAAGEKTTVAAFADIGRYAAHNFMFGAGAGFVNFQADKNATVIYAYAEKNLGDYKRKLFFYSRPGIAIAHKPAIQMQGTGRYEYWKSQPGLHVQAGAGIKYMIGRHSFYISTGFSKTTYSLFAKEYPVPVDPYDPFTENAIAHKYAFAFNRLALNVGFTL